MASTRLTNEDRNLFLSRALRDVLAPRFEALKEAVTQRAREHLAEHHPVFLKLAKDKAARPYLYIHTNVQFYFITDPRRSVRMHAPNDYVRCRTDPEQFSTHTEENCCQLDAKIDKPQNVSIVLQPGDPLITEYKAAWAQLEEVRTTLSDTIYAYNSREKFEADFPNLAHYLPPRKAKTYPVAVPVANLQERLEKLGVPPKKEAA